MPRGGVRGRFRFSPMPGAEVGSFPWRCQLRAMKPRQRPRCAVPLGGTLSCWGSEGDAGSSAAAAIVWQSLWGPERPPQAAAGLGCLLLGLLLSGSLQWGVSAPGHAPLRLFLPELCERPAMLGSWSRCCSRPTCLLLCRGTQSALSLAGVPGGCVENEWKRQLAVLACPLTSTRKNVSDFSLTPWAGREDS